MGSVELLNSVIVGLSTRLRITGPKVNVSGVSLWRRGKERQKVFSATRVVSALRSRAAFVFPRL